MAFEMGAEAAARYAYMHAKQEAQRGKCGAAAAVLASHGCPAEPANYELYRHVAREIVSSPDASSDSQQALKKMLLQLTTALHATPSVDALVLQVGGWCLSGGCLSAVCSALLSRPHPSRGTLWSGLGEFASTRGIGFNRGLDRHSCFRRVGLVAVYSVPALPSFHTRAEGRGRTLRSLFMGGGAGWGVVRAGVQKAARRGALHGAGHADDGQGVARHGGGAEGGAATVRGIDRGLWFGLAQGLSQWNRDACPLDTFHAQVSVSAQRI